MAAPKKADPSQGNRARSILVGTPAAAEPLDLEALAASVVPTDSSPVVSEGPIDLASAVAAPEATTPAEPTQPAAPEATTAVPPAPDADDVDDPRFKGKPKSELYKAYQNLERLKGEHDNELGNYRKLFMEQVLKPQVERPAAPPPPPAEDETSILNEMLTNPSQFKKKTIEQAKKELLDDLTGAAKLTEVQKIKTEKASVLSDPEFGKWLVANVPQSVGMAADHDAATLNFILQSYEKSRTPAAAAATPSPDRRIPVGAAAGVPAASVTTPEPRPIVFKQAELVDMMVNRPEEYARRQPEIIAAYREGRIK